MLHGQVRLAALAEHYALNLEEYPGMRDATISDLVCRDRGEPRCGDRVSLGPLELEVIEADEGGVALAALRFRIRAAVCAKSAGAAAPRERARPRPRISAGRQA